MARRKGRGRRHYSSYGNYVVSQRRELTKAFGGIDRDVERLFLALDPYSLEVLFQAYTSHYGGSAGAYARKTYPNWQSGAVRMSGEVAERLLNLLPPRLPYSVRYDLVKKLRNANFRPMTRHVRTTPERWREDLRPAIEEVVAHGETASLSDRLKGRVSWLANGDVAAAEALMSEAIREESLSRLAYLKVEFQRLDAIIAQLGEYQTAVTHAIELPQGSIQVHIAIPKVSMWKKFTNWLG